MIIFKKILFYIKIKHIYFNNILKEILMTKMYLSKRNPTKSKKRKERNCKTIIKSLATIIIQALAHRLLC